MQLLNSGMQRIDDRGSGSAICCVNKGSDHCRPRSLITSLGFPQDCLDAVAGLGAAFEGREFLYAIKEKVRAAVLNLG